jgi:hypothetical protein
MADKRQKRQKRVDLVCILTGEVIPKQPRARVEKQAKKLKFSDTEDYISYFISRDARKLLAKGNSELEIRKQYKCSETKSIPFHILKCYVKKFKSKDAIDRKRQKKIAEEYKSKPIVMQWKGSETINMAKNKDVCAQVTAFACWRPDIYLDLGCEACILKDNCACPIKNLKRKPHAKRITKAKSI